jgi:hypothetical protein
MLGDEALERFHDLLQAFLPPTRIDVKQLPRHGLLDGHLCEEGRYRRNRFTLVVRFARQSRSC